MTNNVITKIINLKAPGTPFTEDIVTDFIKLDNYKYIDFVITTSTGSVTQTSITAIGRLGESEEEMAPVHFRKKLNNGTDFLSFEENETNFEIGGTENNTGFFVCRVTADDLAKGNFDRVGISLCNEPDTTVTCSIIGVLYEPRYTE